MKLLWKRDFVGESFFGWNFVPIRKDMALSLLVDGEKFFWLENNVQFLNNFAISFVHILIF